MILLENEPMSKHTSFKVGGSARYFAKVESIEDLKAAFAIAREKGRPYFILGNGTNLLVSDKKFFGHSVKILETRKIYARGRTSNVHLPQIYMRSTY